MVVALLTLLVGASSVEQPIQLGDLLCHPRRLLAKYESLEVAEKSVSRNMRILRWMPQINVAVIETPRNSLQRSKRQIENKGVAEWVEFDRAALPAYDPNDPMWPDMWHMKAIKADRAWDISFGGSNAVVAVIDTGVFVGHEDLAANIWINTGEIAGNGIDDDINGYIDDINGYDFAYNDSEPNDVHGHGTACAGIVAGVQDNSLGVTGVAPRARIMALKAALDSGYFYDSATVPAYLYAADNGANVLSMSFYSDRVSAAEGAAIKYCWQNGVLPVAAAGNAATVYPYYPAAYDETLSVAALATNMSKAGFSNFGHWVDVAAPGVSLRTTTVGGYTSGFAGTSGACPHVAGLAALLFGANPAATAEEVRAAIEDTATPVNQPPFGVYCNYGIINCEAAVSAIVSGSHAPRDPFVRAVTGGGIQTADYAYPADNELSFRVLGRGFQNASTVSLSAGGINLPVYQRTRDWISSSFLPPIAGPLEVRLDGALIATVPMPIVYQMAYPLIDASTPGSGASVYGGFNEALNPDGTSIRVTRRSDGVILMHGVFRKVISTTNLDLVVRRAFTGTTVGTETVQVYDWSTASYPYGSFVTLSSGPVPQTQTTSTFHLTNASRFVDPEGTIYLRIVTSNDLPEGTEFVLDQAMLSLP